MTNLEQGNVVTIGNARDPHRIVEIVKRGPFGTLVANLYSLASKLPTVHVPLTELLLVKTPKEFA